jgi:hypothetical protein
LGLRRSAAIIAVIAWVARNVFGPSLLGLRFLPALAGAALVWLTGQVAKEMGGGRTAQALAALAVALAPIYLLMHHWLTMNAFEPLIWLGCVYCILRAINKGQPRYWLAFGVLVGIGMETKYSIAFFTAAVVLGLIATTERRELKSRWFWIGAAAAFLIFLPNLVWLIRHDFPFLELMRNIRTSGRDVVSGPVAFTADQAMLLNPALGPLWIAGLLWLFFAPAARRYRVLGWTYVAVLAMFIVLKGKNYYAAPAYPMLFAAGGIAFEGLKAPVWRSARLAYITIAIAAGVVLTPLTSPVLPVETYRSYIEFTGLTPPRAENQRTGPLPQYFADEFGWEEMTREVARIYHDLPEEQQKKTAIFANNYGEAGAIDFFGPQYGLPKAISHHQSYWFWGPRDYTGETVIVLGSDGRGDREHFKSVEAAGRAYHPYSRQDEQYDIFLCLSLTSDLRSFWPGIKKWN